MAGSLFFVPGRPLHPLIMLYATLSFDHRWRGFGVPFCFIPLRGAHAPRYVRNTKKHMDISPPYLVLKVYNEPLWDDNDEKFGITPICHNPHAFAVHIVNMSLTTWGKMW